MTPMVRLHQALNIHAADGANVLQQLAMRAPDLPVWLWEPIRVVVAAPVAGADHLLAVADALRQVAHEPSISERVAASFVAAADVVADYTKGRT